GQDAGLVRPRDEPRHRGLAFARVVLPAHVVDGYREHRRAHERVPSTIHGRRTGVPRLAADVDGHATHRVAADHDADRDRPAAENRALLDVQLEVRIDGPTADVRLAGVADALELAAEALAVVVPQCEHPGHVEDAGESAGGDHGGCEARAFL